MLLFAAATQGWFLTRNRIYESIALLLIAFTLFRPGFWMDMVSPPFNEVAPSEIVQAAADTQVGENLRVRVAGLNDLGDPIEFVAIVEIPEGASGEERLEAAGISTLSSPMPARPTTFSFFADCKRSAVTLVALRMTNAL